MTEEEKNAEFARKMAAETDVEKILARAEWSDSTDALVLAGEIRRLRFEVRQFDEARNKERAIALELAAELILWPSKNLRDAATCRDIAIELREKAQELRHGHG